MTASRSHDGGSPARCQTLATELLMLLERQAGAVSRRDADDLLAGVERQQQCLRAIEEAARALPPDDLRGEGGAELLLTLRRIREVNAVNGRLFAVGLQQVRQALALLRGGAAGTADGTTTYGPCGGVDTTTTPVAVVCV